MNKHKSTVYANHWDHDKYKIPTGFIGVRVKNVLYTRLEDT